jgi:hypothetical protein
MLSAVHPKLPMIDKSETLFYYKNLLGFKEWGNGGFDDYLMVEKDQIQLHFFAFKALNKYENYGQIYIRTTDIMAVYNEFLERKVPIHLHGNLEQKPWGQWEFSLLDPNNNLLTFGQSV